MLAVAYFGVRYQSLGEMILLAKGSDCLADIFNVDQGIAGYPAFQLYENSRRAEEWVVIFLLLECHAFAGESPLRG